MKKTLLKQLIKEQIRQVLKENSKPIMIDGKEVSLRSLQIEPESPTANAYIDYAEFTDGTELDWKQLEKLETTYPDLVHYNKDYN